MSAVQIKYHAMVIAADSSVTTTALSIGGFLCKTAGTITATAINGRVIVNAHPVTAGAWVDMPFIVGIGCVVTTAGGASGTLAVGQ